MSEEIKKLQESIAKVDSVKLINTLAGDVKSRRPRESRRLLRMTYYRERFAKQMQMIIDDMMKEHKNGIHEDRFFAYAAYENILNKNSLYLKINQSMSYLKNELDPEGIYNEFSEIILIKRMADGIRISYQRDIVEGTEADLVATKILTAEEQKNVYTEKIDEFLEKGKEGEELLITKLHLTEEELEKIEASICQLENIVYKLFPNRIWMVKT
jgi:hypothetical protein